MRSWKRWAGLLAVLAAVLVIWPVPWGGQLGYVTTHGISMEPGFHTGDLAVIHPQRTYRVGEVSAYHNRMLHTVVLHRIVAVDGDRYTFKGDNNSWLDQERPAGSQLIGSLALRVPQGGVWLHRLTSPPLLGMLAFALLASGGVHRRRRKGRMARHAASHHHARKARFDDGFVASGVAGATAAVIVTGTLTGVAWLLPTTHVRPQTITRPRTITLSYSATVRPSPAYDGTTVTAPQPVFRNVTDAITLQVSYRGTPGRLRLDAELSTPGGWTSTVNLAPPRSFSSGSYDLRVPVRLSALDRRAQAAGRVTGLAATPVTVTVIPTMTDAGGDDFSPQFPLTLTPLALTAPTSEAALTARSATSATAMSAAPTDLHLLRHAVRVSTARRLAVAAFALAVLAAAVLFSVASVHRRRGEADRIQRRWRALLLEVQPMPTPPGRPVVDVPAFSALARLAERYELLILHWVRSEVHTYVVQDDTTIFRYRTAAAPGRAVDAAEDHGGAAARSSALVDSTGRF